VRLANAGQTAQSLQSPKLALHAAELRLDLRRCHPTRLCPPIGRRLQARRSKTEAATSAANRTTLRDFVQHMIARDLMGAEARAFVGKERTKVMHPDDSRPVL